MLGFSALTQAVPRDECVAVTVEDSTPYLNGTIVVGSRTIPAKFKVDTGSADIAGLNRNFVETHGLAPPANRRLPSPGAALGGDTQGYLFRVDEIRVGNAAIERPIIGVTTQSGGFENRSDAGTLGARFLSSFNVTLDYPRGCMKLEPLNGFRFEAMNDRSGIWVIAAAPDFSKRFVKYVSAGSPAAKAGLQDGDEILFFDDIPARELSIDRIWKLLAGTGDLTLKVSRAGEVRTVILRLAELIQ